MGYEGKGVDAEGCTCQVHPFSLIPYPLKFTYTIHRAYTTDSRYYDLDFYTGVVLCWVWNLLSSSTRFSACQRLTRGMTMYLQRDSLKSSMVALMRRCREEAMLPSLVAAILSCPLLSLRQPASRPFPLKIPTAVRTSPTSSSLRARPWRGGLLTPCAGCFSRAVGKRCSPCGWGEGTGGGGGGGGGAGAGLLSCRGRLAISRAPPTPLLPAAAR